MGVINAANGELVELTTQAKEDGMWEGDGIHSPGHGPGR